MDHAETLEQLELAALEPGGLDRLTAGDTPAAAAVAGHLVGCASCADELVLLRRSAAVVRDVIRTTPPADLRGRTLDYVRAVGRERGAAAALRPAPAVGAASPHAGRPAAAVAPRTAAFPLGIAAAVLVSVAVGGLVVGLVAQRALGERDAQIARQADVVDALASVTAYSLRVSGESDARSVRLASTTGGAASGTILFSPSTGELVVVADDLVEPPEGSEFRCWVEVDGARRPVGRMFFGGGLSYWVGDVEAVGGLTGGATFGISLSDGSGSTGAEPVLVGGL
jgi:Anti-sigma-K factor rskA